MVIPNKLGNLRDAIIGNMFGCQINVLSEQININPTGSQSEKMLREGEKKNSEKAVRLTAWVDLVRFPDPLV